MFLINLVDTQLWLGYSQCNLLINQVCIEDILQEFQLSVVKFILVGHNTSFLKYLVTDNYVTLTWLQEVSSSR